MQKKNIAEYFLQEAFIKMNQDIVDNINSFGKKLYSNFIRKHPQIFIYFTIFLLLFLGGLRFNPLSSLVIALADTAFIILFFTLFYRMLNGKNASAVKYRMLTAIEMFLFLLLGILCLTLIGKIIIHFFFNEPYMGKTHQMIYPIFKNTLLVMGAAIGSLIHYSNEQFRKTEKLAIEKREMEITLLRSQINPHFVFNALNNIYSLVYVKNENASDAILKLAEMFRYITDECQSETVPVEKEINYIRNYLDFQEIRMGKINNLKLEYNIDNYSAGIPPMILQPFIENCFNHGDIQLNPDGFINLKFSIRNNHLNFILENSKSEIPMNNTLNGRVGVGINNVEQRLRLIYKRNFSLDIKNMPSIYVVNLNIELQNTDNNE